MVDVDTDQASVRGQAKFIWRSTGKSWQDGRGENDHLLIGAETTTWGMALSHPHISPGEFEVDNFGLPPFQEMWAQNRQNWMELNMALEPPGSLTFFWLFFGPAHNSSPE